MKLCIDFGASNVDVVVFDKEVKELTTFPADYDLPQVHHKMSGDYDTIVITGSKSEKYNINSNIIFIDEIKAIAKGGAKLAGLDSCIVTSCGTGTAVTSYECGHAKHLCGTGVGGGTLVGLSKIITGTNDIRKIIEMTADGNSKACNLSIGDVCGYDIGLLNSDMTASNFAKQGQFSKQDIVSSLSRMVSETIIMLSCTASHEIKDIVFTGRVSTIPLFVNIISEFQTIFPGKRFHLPKKREYATAYGLF
jgi:type II pantothenate kinase